MLGSVPFPYTEGKCELLVKSVFFFLRHCLFYTENTYKTSCNSRVEKYKELLLEALGEILPSLVFLGKKIFLFVFLSLQLL